LVGLLHDIDYNKNNSIKDEKVDPSSRAKLTTG